jgi:hypothetical protein
MVLNESSGDQWCCSPLDFSPSHQQLEIGPSWLLPGTILVVRIQILLLGDVPLHKNAPLQQQQQQQQTPTCTTRGANTCLLLFGCGWPSY